MLSLSLRHRKNRGGGGQSGSRGWRSSTPRDSFYRDDDSPTPGTYMNSLRDRLKGFKRPEIRKTISSMASSFQGNRTSVDASCTLMDEKSSTEHSSTCYLSDGFAGRPRKSYRRVVTMHNCTSPVTLDRTGSMTRHSSFGARSVPRDSGLDETMDFRKLFDNRSKVGIPATASKVQGGKTAGMVLSVTLSLHVCVTANKLWGAALLTTHKL